MAVDWLKGLSNVRHLPPTLLLLLPLAPQPTPPPGHPLMLAGPTPHIQWHPAPSHPLVPAPQLICNSWNPHFQQPPLSNLTLAKSHLKVL
ncbi:hypothetical protein RhiXN_06683 [Rhizoctonia solani]|uniref:Uncharacterized protein n=1 Tax=Rhizoctonia solani TaxID=456999 RepID=A0A8H8NXE8_9AGAM|nr:uncharacterized protein RhiXN_06683 [Rhizoctonia solani]QRW21694.1 hypothetical protein RhiXN_06683 [Rhizoctonia solani]